MNPFRSGCDAGITRLFRGDPLEWLTQHVRLPHSARSTTFDPRNSPWLNDIITAVTDDRIKQIVVKAPTGGGKTTLLELIVPWIIAQQPGPLLYAGQTEETAKDWAESRLMPVLEACGPVAKLFPQNRHKKRTTSILFPHMAMYLGGSNLTALQEKSMRYCYGDECWRWDAGAITELKARHHDRWNRKTILVSQAGTVGEDFDNEFQAGVIREWGSECESCGRWHKMLWTSIRYDEAKTPNGEWDWQRVVDSVRHHCPHCDHVTLDTTQGRRGLASRGSYEVQSDNQPLAGHASFTWSALAVWWVSWSDLVVEWIKAQDAKRAGMIDPLRQFLQKRLAQSWRADNETPEMNLTAGDYYLADHIDGQPIDNEAKRLMAIDVQRDHFWSTIRAYRVDGTSRLVWAGKVLTVETLKALQQRQKVHDKLTFIDAQHRTGEVYDFCVRHGWTALHGSGKETFPHVENGKTIQKFYSKVNLAEAPKGGKARYIFWANEGVKDRLSQLRAQGSPVWEYPMDVSPDYLRQINSELKREVVDKATKAITHRYVKIHRDNHMWDTEAMTTAAALMVGLIRGD